MKPAGGGRPDRVIVLGLGRFGSTAARTLEVYQRARALMRESVS